MSKESAYFSLQKVDGKHDVKKLKRELDSLRGVISVSVNEMSDRIAVDFDTTGVDSSRIQNKIETLGYDIVKIHIENHIM